VEFSLICSGAFQAAGIFFLLLKSVSASYYGLFRSTITVYSVSNNWSLRGALHSYWLTRHGLYDSHNPCLPCHLMGWGDNPMSTLVGACVTGRVSHNPCPVKGQATTCVAPLHNWLCLVTGSSCRVTNLSRTASVAQLRIL
jgi:hypothetical protein